MRQRIITGAILAIFIGVLVYFGEGKFEFLFSGFCVILSGIASYEFTNLTKKGKKYLWFDYLSIIFVITFSLISVIYFTNIDYYKYIFIFILVILLFYSILFVSNKEFTKEEFGNNLLKFFYTSLGFIAFAYLRKTDIVLIIYLFSVSMLTDVFAYFFGIKFGKHRLAINISPKKSVEGAVAGLLIGSLLASVIAYYFNVFEVSIYLVIILSLILSAISQIGDLIASKFKREAGIKDYSNLFPGHGGVLDRFDSSMFAAIFLMLAVIIL